MVNAGWPPDPDVTVVVPLASLTVNVTLNPASVPPDVDPDPPQLWLIVKLEAAPLWVWVNGVLPYV